MKLDMETIYRLLTVYLEYELEIAACSEIPFKVGEVYHLNDATYEVAKYSGPGENEVCVRQNLDNGYCYKWVFKALLRNGKE